MPKQDYEEDISQMFQLVLDSIPSRVFWKDRDLNFRGSNQLFAEDAGASSPADMIGKNDFDFPWSDHAEAYRSDDTEVMESGIAKVDFEEAQSQPDGSTNWLLSSKVPLRNQQGDVVGLLGTYSDITPQKRHEEELRRQAMFDALTKLPNRHHLTLYLEHFLPTDRSQYAALLFIDLDHFKAVNDTMGHDVGDQVLVEVARRLLEAVPKAAHVARLGGDEFCVLLAGLSEHEATAKGYISKACRNILRAVKMPFEVKQNLIYLGGSIGISVIGADCNDSNAILREADLAMYSVKARSRNSFAFYCSEFDQASVREHTLQNGIRQALENDEFSLAFQPQLDKNGWLLGVEALIRCESEELGPISPNDFIPLAEETGLIHPLGDWAVNEALKQFAAWRDNSDNHPLPQISINISAKQFQHPDLVNKLREAASWHQVPTHQIMLEITEGTFFSYEERGLERLHELKKLGFKLALDDFGTGFSSLSYLAQMPLDELKIDRSFISQMLEQPRVATIVETLINLAKSLGLELIAEGVETHAQQEWLLERGCSNFQGFLYSRPLDPTTLAERHL